MSESPAIDTHPLRLSVFVATSVDGFIATIDGGLDWLNAAVNPDEDYGYYDFLDRVDAVAMGRRTYDSIAHIDPLPFGSRPVFVFTRRKGLARDGVVFIEATPADAVVMFKLMGLGRVYVDGGVLISSFMEYGLINDLTITRVPVLLGVGTPLFCDVITPTVLTLESSRSWPSGVVSHIYSVPA